PSPGTATAATSGPSTTASWRPRAIWRPAVSPAIATARCGTTTTPPSMYGPSASTPRRWPTIPRRSAPTTAGRCTTTRAPVTWCCRSAITPRRRSRSRSTWRATRRRWRSGASFRPATRRKDPPERPAGETPGKTRTRPAGSRGGSSKSGAKGTRTPDPHTASVVRYQLRQSPKPLPIEVTPHHRRVQHRWSGHLAAGLRTERPGLGVLGGPARPGLGRQHPAHRGHREDRPTDDKRPTERCVFRDLADDQRSDDRTEVGHHLERRDRGAAAGLVAHHIGDRGLLRGDEDAGGRARDVGGDEEQRQRVGEADQGGRHRGHDQAGDDELAPAQPVGQMTAGDHHRDVADRERRERHPGGAGAVAQR